MRSSYPAVTSPYSPPKSLARAGVAARAAAVAARVSVTVLNIFSPKVKVARVLGFEPRSSVLETDVLNRCHYTDVKRKLFLFFFLASIPNIEANSSSLILFFSRTDFYSYTPRHEIRKRLLK